MTAMFVVIFMDQYEKDKIHISSFIGLGGVSILCLIIFGSDSFMIPTMITIILLLTLLKKPIEKKEKLIDSKGDANLHCRWNNLLHAFSAFHFLMYS